MTLIQELRNLASNSSLLIVEDDKDLNEELTDYFSIFFDKVDSAFNGVEGLDKTKRYNYDVILTDFNMPQMDGFSMINRLLGNIWEKCDKEF